MVEPDVLDRLEHLRVQRVERGQLAAPPARASGELTFSARWSTDDCIGLFSSWLLSARRRHACDTIEAWGGVRLVVRLAIVQVTAVA
jgi:hypothetical protein